jgi:NAD(P)-dependent dehydrogenase (short-subunit alcohol dehydrogenase family)
MAVSVSGKSALVTGAGSGMWLSGQYSSRLIVAHSQLGINLSFAKLLLEHGCNVLIADLALRPEAQVLVDKHSRGPSARAVFQKTDVRDWVQLERMFEVAEKEFGELDIVCPGAGVYEPVRGPFKLQKPSTPRTVR